MASVSALDPPAKRTQPAADEPLYEIVNGQRLELPPMSIYAAWTAFELAFQLASFVRARVLGTIVTEGMFILDAERNLRRRPDVAFVADQSWPLDRGLPQTGDWNVVPDLAVEVISPNEDFEEVLSKMREYFQRGVRQVWLVLPIGRQIHVYEAPNRGRILTHDDELDGGELLPGFRLPLANLFPRPIPADRAPNGQ